MVLKDSFYSVVGELYIEVVDGRLRRIAWSPSAAKDLSAQTSLEDTFVSRKVKDETICQLNAYFRGELKQFDLPIEPIGTPFQLRAWNELLNIPYGKTISYSEQASRMGCPKAVRAVANANRCNPLSIVIPCHRVIGSNGELTGYAGGLKAKQQLLELERGQTSLWMKLSCGKEQDI